MSSIAFAALVFGLTFAGALGGIALRDKLPQHHQDSDSRDVVKLVMGLVATVAALVLSLLIASAHSSYDTQETEIQQLGAHIALLDRILAHYGPEAAEARTLLRRIVASELDRIWPKGGAVPATSNAPAPRAGIEEFINTVATLTPKSDVQRFAQGRVMQLMTDVGTTRRLMSEQAGGSLSWPFFVVLVSWLVALFVGFGLFARRNATVVTALLVGAFTIGGAIFLILEMSRPYSGLMQISDAPIRNALAPMGQ